jgi:hypothetical protein
MNLGCDGPMGSRSGSTRVPPPLQDLRASGFFFTPSSTNYSGILYKDCIISQPVTRLLSANLTVCVCCLVEVLCALFLNHSRFPAPAKPEPRSLSSSSDWRTEIRLRSLDRPASHLFRLCRHPAFRPDQLPPALLHLRSLQQHFENLASTERGPQVSLPSNILDLEADWYKSRSPTERLSSRPFELRRNSRGKTRQLRHQTKHRLPQEPDSTNKRGRSGLLRVRN